MKTLTLFLMLLPTTVLADPTYTKDVQPIFKSRCSQCHDYMAGRNWQNYDNAFEFRIKIKEKVATKEMPMGREMPQEERDLVIKWVNTGAKR